jgi:hypothetical protein
MRALGSSLGTLERATQSNGDPTNALHDAVAAIGKGAQRAAGKGALDARRRRQLVSQGAQTLSAIIRRGVESGTFRPSCARWAVDGLPYAIAAGLCARWAFDLPEEQSPRAGAVVEAALAVLRPRLLARS